MHSIAPFWDANQTWLVLGGGGLLISFPLAYSILLAAYYVPIICMLIGLVFRGACFEFYMKESEPSIKMLWSYGFHFGSLCAAFFQGCILGSYIQGVTVIGRNFAGQSWDWFSGLSMMMGILLVFGYALIGASWGIIKTSEETQRWTRYAALYTSIIVSSFAFVIFLMLPMIQPQIGERWFATWGSTSLTLAWILFLGALMIRFWKSIRSCQFRQYEYRPFLYIVSIFALSCIGLGLSMHPWIVPYHYTLDQASAADTSLSLILIGMLIVMPVILAYTIYTYSIFWGKSHVHQNEHY